MRRFSLLIAAVVALICSPVANAQYYEIANQLPKLISPALSGSLNYKGYVEFSGLAGLGDNRANFLEISTTQGFKYASWFFMGVGAGLPDEDLPDYYGHGYSKTKAMIPVFSDFRFMIGPESGTSFFIDLKLGAAWLMGSGYLRMIRGCLTNQTQFYFKPSLGIRIPVSSQNPRQAVNIGVTYQLLTSNNNYNWYDRSLTLNSIGATIGFEW